MEFESDKMDEVISLEIMGMLVGGVVVRFTVVGVISGTDPNVGARGVTEVPDGGSIFVVV